MASCESMARTKRCRLRKRVAVPLDRANEENLGHAANLVSRDLSQNLARPKEQERVGGRLTDVSAKSLSLKLYP